MHTNEGWRWCYDINAILSFASFAGLLIAYHPPTYRQLHNHPTDDPPRKDWLGLLAFTTSIALVAYALGWGKLTWSGYTIFPSALNLIGTHNGAGWDSPQVITVTVVGGVSLVGILVYGKDNLIFP